ncbi:MAG: SDR family oxidoreductase [Pirellulaceae bacterium]
MTEPTVFLTGATGLVGSQILHRLLRADVPVCVLCRKDNRGTAQQRLEAALMPFEEDALLPRPRVITGELGKPDCGVSSQDLEWLQGREVSVVHSAASIRFQEDSSGEPYATNVAGTRNLLQLCNLLQVRDFHHVSTAYVGGRGGGSEAVLESADLDLESAGNDYERSKIQAEALVQSSSVPSGRTVIHRPSIVVGDSKSHRTTTFHGFYAPLQIGAQYAQAFGFSKGMGEWFREQLGLSPDDVKNLVPVDWVADCVAQVVQDESISAGVYHWTHASPVSAVVMQDAITDSIERLFSDSHESSSSDARTEQPAAGAFREQMSIYESYFKCDPQFDVSRARQVTQQLPCPTVDYEFLCSLSDFALQSNFGWPKPQLPDLQQESEWVHRIRGFDATCGTCPDVAALADFQFELRLLGKGAPESIFVVKEGARWFATSSAATSDVEYHWQVSMPLDVLTGCFTRTTRLLDTFQNGRGVALGRMPANWLAIIEHWIHDVIAQSAS